MRKDCPFLQGIARAMWVSCWADRQEEKGKRLQGELMDLAPKTPMRFLLEAARFIGNLEAVNRLHHACLISRAYAADNLLHVGTETWDDSAWVHDEDFHRDFGHYLAMQAMGHGVSWWDDHASFTITVPHVEVGY